MKRSKRWRRVTVSADGRGVVSHAGVGMLRELACDTGLVTGVTAALADTYAGPWQHAPGQVFTDLAVAIADGGDCVSHMEVFGDRHQVGGPVASMPTTWRLLDRIDPTRLPGIRAARAAARERAWAAGASPALTSLLRIDFDATVTISHSEDKENAAKTWKRTYGFQCAMRRSDVSPDQPGGTWKEVSGPNDLPNPETVMGTRACQETDGHAETPRMARQEARVTWRKLDCLNPNLQRRQRRLHRHGVWGRCRRLRRLDGMATAPSRQRRDTQ